MRHLTILAVAIAAALSIPTFAVAGTTPPSGVQEFVPIGTVPQTVGSAGITATCGAPSGAPCAPNTPAAAPQAIGNNSLASGPSAYAGGAHSVALGYRAVADGSGALAAGSRAAASGAYAVALGGNSGAAGDSAVALGQQALAADNGDVAIGSSATANASQGVGSTAPSGVAIAIGANASATGVGAMAFGSFSMASGTGSVAIGQSAFSTGDNSIAIFGMSSGLNSVAIGGATSSGTDTLADGYGAGANGNGSISIGESAAADSMDNGTDIAIGPFASVAADGGVAIGEEAATGSDAANATVIGDFAQADNDGAVALGEGSVADDGDAVSVGSDVTGSAFQRSIVNVAPGVGDFDAVDVSQLTAGGSAIAAWIGGGAAFSGSGVGTFTAPTFTLSNPYTAGVFGTVSGAITALDAGITDAAAAIAAGSTGTGTGAQGTPGAPGAQGPVGAAGKNGVGVVQFTDAAHTAARVGTPTAGPESAKAPVTLQNVAAGTQPTDAVNVAQMQQGDAQTLSQANAYTDTHAVEYVPHSDPIVALRPDTTLENVAASTAPTDAVNVAQLDASQSAGESWARSYADYVGRQALTTAEQYTNAIGAGLNRRIDYALSAAGADAQAAAALAGQSRSEPNRIAVGTGWTSGVGALNVTYQHLLPGSRWAWNVGLTRSAGYGSGTTISAGASYGW